MEFVVVLAVAADFQCCKPCFHTDYDGEEDVFSEQARNHGIGKRSSRIGFFLVCIRLEYLTFRINLHSIGIFI